MMKAQQENPVADAGWRTYLIVLSTMLIYVGVPLIFAGITDYGANGTAGLFENAKNVFCANGLSSITMIMMIETGIMIVIFLAANIWRKGLISQIMQKHGGLLIFTMILIVIPNLIAWQTDSSVCTRGKAFFWESIFIEVFILAALAVSYNLLFGFTGVVSFAHAAFFGIGAYTVGIFMLHLDWPLGLAVLAALLISVIMGILISVIGVRIKGLYFSIFTLAFGEIFYVLSQNRIMSSITGAEDGFTFAVPDWINAAQNRLTFYYLALIFLIFCYWLVRRVVKSPTGRVMSALRDNEERAIMLGYNTFIYKTSAIVLSGAIATAAGILRGLLNKGANPNVLGVGFTMDPLLMTLIGGSATFAGPVTGAFLIALLRQVLRDASFTIGAIVINIGERWALILGILFILSVLVFPAGIVGTLQQQWQKWQLRRKKGQSVPETVTETK